MNGPPVGAIGRPLSELKQAEDEVLDNGEDNRNTFS